MRKKCLFVAIFALFLTTGAFALPDEASAAPLLFTRPRGNFTLGFDIFDPVVGSFGDETRVGLAGFAQASLQMGYWGLTLRTGAGRGFTEKTHIPFDEGYQLFYLTFGPRVVIPPFRKLQLYFYLQPEITLDILHSNTLVQLTGNDPYFGAAGGSVGVHWIIGILVVEAQVSFQWMWALDSLMITGGISVGIGGTFATQ